MAFGRRLGRPQEPEPDDAPVPVLMPEDEPLGDFATGQAPAPKEAAKPLSKTQRLRDEPEAVQRRAFRNIETEIMASVMRWPSSLLQMPLYAIDPHNVPEPATPEQQEWIDSLEQAQISSGNYIPVDMLLRMAEEDIADVGATPELIQPLIDQTLATESWRSYEDFVAKQAQARMDGWMRANYGTDELITAFASDVNAKEAIENQRLKFEEEIRDEVFGYADPDAHREPATLSDVGMGIVEGGFGLLGRGIGWIAREGGGAIARGADLLFGSDVTDQSRTDWERDRDERIKDIEDSLAEPPERLRFEATQPLLTTLFEEERRANSDEYQEYLAMAGGDTAVAFGMFTEDLLHSNDPQVRSQLAQLETGYRAAAEDMIDFLREEDFELGDKILEAISSYGRGMMWAGTAITLIATDNDMAREVMSGDFMRLYTEVERHDAVPSAALGLDGTLIGLGYDFFLTWYIDPLRFTIGGRLASARVRSAADAFKTSRAAPVQHQLKEFIGIRRDPARGATATTPARAVFDQVGLGPMADDIARGRPFMARARRWVQHKLGRHSDHVDYEDLAPYVDDIAREQADDWAAKGTNEIDMETHLLNGTDSPLELTYSLNDEAAALTDGNKRVVVAERMANRPATPVTVRVIEESLPKTRVLHSLGGRRWTGEAAQHIDDVAAHGVKPKGTFAADESTVEKVLKAADDVESGPLADRVTTYELGAHTLDDGRTVFLKTAQTDDGVLYYAVDEGGNAVAAVLGDDASFSMGTSRAFRREGVMTELWEQAERQGVDLIDISGKSASVSTDAVAFSQTYAKRILARNVNQLPPGPSGTPLASVMGPEDAAAVHRTARAAFDEGANVDSGVYVRPSRILPENYWLGADSKAVLQELTRLYETALRMGAYPDAHIMAGFAHVGGMSVREAMRGGSKTGIGRWTQRYMGSRLTTGRVSVQGPTAYYDVRQLLISTAAHDADMIEFYLARLDDAMATEKHFGPLLRELGVKIRAVDRQIAAIEDLIGSPVDDILQHSQAGRASLSHSSREAIVQQYAPQLGKLHRELRNLQGQTDDIIQQMPERSAIIDVVEDFYTEYNRKHIASQKYWKQFVNEDGIVPWDVLRKGIPEADSQWQGFIVDQPFVPDSLADSVSGALGIEAESLAQNLLGPTLNTRLSVSLPLSPLDLIASSELSGALWRQYTKNRFMHNVRRGLQDVQRLWTVDKILRLSTATKASFDELTRIFYEGGGPAIEAWIRDRGVLFELRARAMLSNKAPWRTQNASAGMAASRQARLQALSDIQARTLNAERSYFEANGMKWVDVAPDNPMHRAAAAQWTGNHLQNTSFRSFLLGEDAFRQFYNSADGHVMRTQPVRMMDGTVRTWANWREAYQAMQAWYDDVLLANARKNGTVARADQVWRETAKAIDDAGGRPHNLPSDVLDEMGTVRGAIPREPSSGLVGPVLGNAQEWAFEHLFMHPTNYRRGFLSDLTRKFERERLLDLYATQGMEVLDDAAYMERVGLQGMVTTGTPGFRQYLQEMARRQGVVLKSSIDELIERRVAFEIEDMLYRFNASSRAGQQARVIAPFGKPWADMFGFWSRVVGRSPVVRNGLRNRAVGRGLQSVFDRLPFNPRPLGAMSRLASLNFDISRGFSGEGGGLLPGSEETGLGRIFFLPVGGENPFWSIIPGLGPVPLMGLDYIIDLATDWENDPIRAQQVIDGVAQIIPGEAFPGGAANRWVKGTGVVNSIGNVVNMFTGNGDLRTNLDARRQLNVMLAEDPDFFPMLLALADPAEVEAMLQSMATDASFKAHLGRVGETAIEWAVPIGEDFSHALAEIDKIWIEATNLYPGLIPDAHVPLNQDDPAVRRAFAADIREAFWKLPGGERDLIIGWIAPQLAVNTVGTYRWSDQAASDPSRPETKEPYTVDGSPQDLSRHQLRARNGDLDAVDVLTAGARIVDRVWEAQERSVTSLYSDMATTINDALWDERVSKNGETINRLEWILEQGQPLWEQYDIHDIRTLWENWSTLRGRFKQWGAEQYGHTDEFGRIDLTDEQSDAFNARIKIPGDEQAWGTKWPGMNPQELSSRVADIQIGPYLDDEFHRKAEIMGIEVSPEMSGIHVYAGIHLKRTELTAPARGVIKGMTNVAKADEAQQAEEDLRGAVYRLGGDPDYRMAGEAFIFRADELIQFKRDTGEIALADELEVKEQFDYLAEAGEGLTDFDGIWENKYEPHFGARDEKLPEPPEVTPDNSWRPYVRNVLNGNTILVSEASGPSIPGTLGKLGPSEGPTRRWPVRIIGLPSTPFSQDRSAHMEEWETLEALLHTAVNNGLEIRLVRDPEQLGRNTDAYGREMAWLFIGDDPVYDAGSLRNR